MESGSGDGNLPDSSSASGETAAALVLAAFERAPLNSVRLAPSRTWVRVRVGVGASAARVKVSLRASERDGKG